MSFHHSGSEQQEDRLMRLGGISGWLSGSLILVMMVAILREVVGRYFFNVPSDWSLELSGYLLVALTYLGAPYTELSEANIRIDFLYSRFSPGLRVWADTIIYLICLCWSAMIVWQGWMLAWGSWKVGARSSEAMAWPLFPSQVLVPIGAFLVCLILIQKIYRKVRLLTSGKVS